MKRIFIFALIFAISLTTLCINASAETLPEFPYASTSHYREIVFVDEDGKYMLYTIFSDYPAGYEVDGFNAKIYTNPSGETFLEIDRKGLDSTSTDYSYAWRVHILNNGQWAFKQNGNSTPPSSTIQIGPFTEIVHSEIDIYKDGILFFPLPPKPLYQTIAEVGAQTLQSTAEPAVASTMMILTLCGVGLMALLMALPLLGKIFRRYRS